MALKANLYLDRINISRYFPKKDCDKSCGLVSCEALLQNVREGKARIAQCPRVSSNFAHAAKVVLSLSSILPEVDITQHPVKGIVGLHEINGAGPDSPVLVTGNALATQEVIMAILSTTTAPFHVLFIDCLGHTVDMAMIYAAFAPESLVRAIEEFGLAPRLNHRELILPGATSALKDAMGAQTGWKIRIGPYCAGELPLFVGEMWSPPLRQ